MDLDPDRDPAVALRKPRRLTGDGTEVKRLRCHAIGFGPARDHGARRANLRSRPR